MSSVPSAEAQLLFLTQIQRLFDEGEFVATYKFELLTALTELLLKGGMIQMPPCISLLHQSQKNLLSFTGNRLSLTNRC